MQELVRNEGTTRHQKRESAAALTPEQVEGYLDCLAAKGRVPDTIENYRRGMRRLYRDLPGGDKVIRPGTLRQWREQLIKDGYSATAVNQFIVAANGYLDYVHARELQVTDKLRVPKETRPELARNLPLTGAMVAERVAKTGGTPFRCAEVRTHVEPGLIISASAINAMRRDVLNQLTALRARRDEQPIRKPKAPSQQRGGRGLPGLTVQVTTREQLTPTLLNLETAMLYVPLHILLEDDATTLRLVQRGRLAVALPRIVHDGELPKLTAGLRKLRDLGVKDALVGNLGLLAPVREAGMRIHGDFGLNIYNSRSMDVMKELELTSATVSFEMTLPQIRDLSKPLNAELIAYGRLPLMLTEHCLIHGRTGECTCHLGLTKLTDKTGADFPIIRDGDSCRSVLLNGKKLSWLDRQDDLAKVGVWAIRLYFTTENSREVDRVMNDYLSPAPMDPGACTRGLYLRGVE